MTESERFAASFRSLNDEQRTAATATEGYVRVIAGAGSGKTRALTHRYAYLVRAAGIHPSNILCVTFTNKAAGEMKKRVRSLVGDGYDTSLITTYHGFCVRVLREDIHRLMWPKSFAILDESDQRRILSEIYAEMEIKMDRATFEKILDSVHRLKSNEDYVLPMIRGDVSALSPPPVSPVEPGTPLESEIVRRYLEKQRKLFGLDFDDLVSFAFAVFRDYPEVAEKWSERLYYVQVDEFQDSSKRELRLLKLLSSRHRNLFVVGDPDQNIYEWRGADMSILVDFDKHFPGARTILMDRNYRSTGNILRAANTLVAHNRNRFPKNLRTEDGPGAEVIHLHAKTEAEEGRFITDEILRLTREEGIPFKGVAVLYRAGFLSRFVEQALTKAAVPYELYGGVRFYERMEIRDTLAYLRLIRRDDDDAFERIVNTPRRSFGRAKVETLRLLAREEGITLYSALKDHLAEPLFSRSGAPEFVGMIEELRAKAETAPVSELMQEVLTRSGYEQYIRELGSMERLDNLAEMKRSLWEREQGYGEFYPLSVYLQEAALESDREADGEADRVKLMTIHASKGLEFPACFVVGFTEGIFPSGRTLEERKDAGLEEERRLCFVAMTRAMKRLYLTESEGASSDRTTKRPSRFLSDIGEENYRRIGVVPKELTEQSGTGAAISAEGTKPQGERVEHPIFGPGTVEETDLKKGVYYIRFDRSGELRPVSMDYQFGAALDLGLDTSFPEEPLPAPAPSEPDVPEERPSEEARLPEPESSDKPETEPAEQKKLYPWEEYAEKIPPRATFPQAEDTPRKKEKPSRRKKEDDNQISLTLPEEPSAPKMPDAYRTADWANPPEGEENLWKREDVPHEGWVCAAVIDLGEPVGTCRMCGHQIIRYVHVMRHPDWPSAVGAGCVCAGRMEGDPEAARAREAAFKNRQARRETFLSTKMKRSRKGNEYCKYKGELVTLLPDRFRPGCWKTAVRGDYTAPRPTREEALSDAFDILDPWEL
ncbi:MAG: AAA family ATPase [Ruminococcaceae bacterium]|jgi:DNA helicase-2/ATP-dependent DNA helicase PcrA|nr:AAA family ATPase [Oscillospiraceae bacterium]